MQKSIKEHPKEKPGLHPRNLHRERYDFELLCRSCPDLASFVKLTPYKEESIDFFDPNAVKMLNKALLKHYYKIDHWDLPEGYLCPPIPGRADYIHYMADLLATDHGGKTPVGSNIRCLDIGIGANCIYPILGNRSYGWSFTGSDIDPKAVENARRIIEENPSLSGEIKVFLQKNSDHIFTGIIQPGEYFDLVFCNPPFHSSAEEAKSGSQRKNSRLKGERISSPILNFGGRGSELWCEGGEEQFVKRMITQSSQWAISCRWFSALISKSAHLQGIYHSLERIKAKEVRTIQMIQGNKISRIVAWSFTDPNSTLR
jgi:23S rRNA (adenine1618-N6)-methyltransferase